MPGQTYYIKRGGKTIGPLTGGQIGGGIKKKAFKGSDRIGTAKSGDFVPLKGVYRDVVTGSWRGVPKRTNVIDPPVVEDDWLDELDTAASDSTALAPIAPKQPVYDAPAFPVTTTTPRARTPKKGTGGKFCMNCGSEIDKKAVVCVSCGVSQRGTGGSTEKSKIVAFLLAWFFGGLGLHKFYIGHPGAGLCYLLSVPIALLLAIPTLGISLILPFALVVAAGIEGIVYLLSSDESFASKCG